MTTRAEIESLVREADAMYLVETYEPEQTAMIRRLSVAVKELLADSDDWQHIAMKSYDTIHVLREGYEMQLKSADYLRREIETLLSDKVKRSTVPSESERSDPAS